MKNKGVNILICGLGGQGVVLFGKILANYFINKGFDIKVSNVIGLGQRGGNTECHFRYSDTAVMSPFIKYGDADYIISFELTETLRNLHYLKKDGIIISNIFEMSTPIVNIGIQKDVQGNKVDIIKEHVKNVFFINPKEHISEAMEPTQMVNILMLAFFASHIGYDDVEIKNIIKKLVHPHKLQDNIAAYNLGTRMFADCTNGDIL